MGQKRPKCRSCSNSLTPWGRTSSGRKRYGCNNCRKTRIYKEKVKKVDFFELFRKKKDGKIFKLVCLLLQLRKVSR